MTARRDLTPVTVTEQYPSLRTGKVEVWAAVSKDGIWKYDRLEDTGTPWIVTHVPTGRQAWYPSLPKARKATADGTALAYLDSRQPADVT